MVAEQFSITEVLRRDTAAVRLADTAAIRLFLRGRGLSGPPQRRRQPAGLAH
jgi:hypothetical protein